MAEEFPCGDDFVKKIASLPWVTAVSPGFGISFRMGFLCSNVGGREMGYGLIGKAAGERADQAGRGPGKRHVYKILFL